MNTEQLLQEYENALKELLEYFGIQDKVKDIEVNQYGDDIQGNITVVESNRLFYFQTLNINNNIKAILGYAVCKLICQEGW